MTNRAAEQEAIEEYRRQLNEHHTHHESVWCSDYGCGDIRLLLAALQRRNDELAEVKADRKDILKERAGLFSEITALTAQHEAALETLQATAKDAIRYQDALKEARREIERWKYEYNQLIDARARAGTDDLNQRAGSLSFTQRREYAEKEVARLSGVCAAWAMTCSEQAEEIERLRGMNDILRERAERVEQKYNREDIVEAITAEQARAEQAEAQVRALQEELAAEKDSHDRTARYKDELMGVVYKAEDRERALREAIKTCDCGHASGCPVFWSPEYAALATPPALATEICHVLVEGIGYCPQTKPCRFHPDPPAPAGEERRDA